MKFSSSQTISLNTFILLIAIIFIFAMTPVGHAQGYARISGTIADPTAAAVPNAHVVATRVNTNEQTAVESGGDGSYVFPSLSPAEYSITVSAPGFSNYVQRNIILLADQALTVNVSLQVGGTTQTVDVSAAPPQVDTTTGTLSQVIGQQSVNDLPLNGRNAAALTTLVAGVVIAPNAQADQGNTKTFPVAVTVTANGTRVGQMNYLLDGGNNVDEYTNVNAPFPMPDALQEFSVQTSNYNAQYGQNAGGVVDIVTRSGSSQYHGNLFEYVRNRAFNAANYFSYVSGVKTVDPLKRNQFGGTFGGPVAVPHVFRLNNGFFFVGYQKTIRRTQATSSTAATLPTTAQLNGTFAGENACIINPFQPTHVYPCTKIGNTYTTQVSPADYSNVSKNLLTHLPSGGTAGTFIFRKPTYEDFDEFTARYDQQIGDKDRLTVRYFSDSYHLDGVLDLTNLLTYADQADIKYYNSLISETHTFNSHLLNNFVLNYQIDNASRGPIAGSINMNDLGVNIWQPAFKQINSIAVSGFFTVGDNPQGFFRRANYTLGDDVHVLIGNHNLAFGFHAENSKVDVDNFFRQPGTFTFNNNNTGFNPSTGLTTAGDAIASFLFGYMFEFQQASGQFLNLRGHFYGFYGQDSWKISRNFTLNYGLRYEPFIPWHEKEGRMGSFSPTLYAANTHSTKYPLAPAGLQFAGDPGFNSDGVPHAYTHFMPRVGFAWDVFGTGRTSLRGGAGMFFDTRLSSVFFNIYSNTSPFITNVDVTNSGGAKITFADPYGSYGTPNPFPAPQPPPNTSPIPPQAFLTYDPFSGFQDPVTYSWNLSSEQQITNGLFARAAYVGSHASHLWVPMELNPFQNGRRIYNPASCTAAANNCYTQPITAANTGSNSIFHSLQLSAEQRLHNGLTLLANYTWSKALDDMPWNAAATSIGAGNSYVYPIYVNNFKALDYGPSDFDHRNVASISYVYNLPARNGGSYFMRLLTNGWLTTGLFQFRSGDPLTILSGASNNSGSGQNRDRAVRIGNPYGGNACSATTFPPPCKPYLNQSSFTNNAAGAYGSVQKGSVIGPQYADWDISLAKSFFFTERVALQLRGEYFNILNHTNFLDPNTGYNTTTFGRITGANDPRIAQLSGKLFF